MLCNSGTDPTPPAHWHPPGHQAALCLETPTAGCWLGHEYYPFHPELPGTKGTSSQLQSFDRRRCRNRVRYAAESLLEQNSPAQSVAAVALPMSRAGNEAADP